MHPTQARVRVGPLGPFPRAPLTDPIERRWLHYAFFSLDHRLSLIANIADLGPEADVPGFHTAVLLLHEAEAGWSSSQWNCGHDDPPWSAFRTDGSRAGSFSMQAAKGTPAVSLQLTRTSTPCAAQTATFHRDHWMRWQSEPGILAKGTWSLAGGRTYETTAIGYHERVRGRWGWPEMGGWVFGFCNDLDSGRSDVPPWSVVFTLLQPSGSGQPQSASLMVWRKGRLVRHIPRACIVASVAGQLHRDRVAPAPGLGPLLGTGPTVAIPAALCIRGVQGRDAVEISFRAQEAARLIIPSETSFLAYSVHEVIGSIHVAISLNGAVHAFESPAVVEFAGGAARPEHHAY